MKFFSQIDDYIKTAKANFKAKLVIASLCILLVIIFSISLTLSLSKILYSILSILLPIYYSLKKKKLEQQLKEGREVSEKEKIRVYLDNINEKFRSKRK